MKTSLTPTVTKSNPILRYSLDFVDSDGFVQKSLIVHVQFNGWQWASAFYIERYIKEDLALREVGTVCSGKRPNKKELIRLYNRFIK